MTWDRLSVLDMGGGISTPLGLWACMTVFFFGVMGRPKKEFLTVGVTKSQSCSCAGGVGLHISGQIQKPPQLGGSDWDPPPARAGGVCVHALAIPWQTPQTQAWPWFKACLAQRSRLHSVLKSSPIPLRHHTQKYLCRNNLKQLPQKHFAFDIEIPKQTYFIYRPQKRLIHHQN